MDSVESIFDLRCVLDDPRYEGFGSVGDGIRHEFLVDDFLPEPPVSNKWQAPRLSDVWKPIKVAGQVRGINDYPCVDAHIPAFSRRAVDVLREFLEPNGELLPFSSPVGPYWAYNVTTISDALDETRSKFSSTGVEIFRHEFHVDRLSGLSIFRIYQTCIGIYVTDRFVMRVEANDLHGFHFQQVWPMPTSGSRPKDQLRELPPGQSFKGNTLVLRLYLKALGGKPSTLQRQQIDKMMDELEALLFEPDSLKPAIGAVEGHEYMPGECRIFLTCPDVDALFKHLRPWLKKLHWPPGFRVLRRYGEFVDPDAPEEYVENI